MNLHQNMS